MAWVNDPQIPNPLDVSEFTPDESYDTNHDDYADEEGGNAKDNISEDKQNE